MIRVEQPATTRANRVASLDVMRGVVMVLMAIDHVRVYSGLPPGGPFAGIFFTRWVTHFCAPAFAFFAGTSAFLHGHRLGDRAALARYLVTRGLVLVVLELTVIRVAWTFNVDFANYMLAGVIWMLGWCMILLAGLVWLPIQAVATLAVIIIGGHNLVDVLPSESVRALRGSTGWIGQFLYFGGVVQLGHDGPPVAVLYSIVPWIGVMAAGYAFGTVVVRERSARDRLFATIGCAAIVLFVALRALDLYGDPNHWTSAPAGAPPVLFRFLATNKYPASLLFLLMTLGPVTALLPLAGRVWAPIADLFSTFGRVPLFYYLVHIPVIHAAALVVSYLRQGAGNAWLFENHPMMNPPPPPGYAWPLPLLYLVFVIVIAILYVPCRWFAGLKARRHDAWLRYL